MPIIGLSGRKQSGKDTAYGFIKEYCEKHGVPCRREAFADRLKLSAARLFYPSISRDNAIIWADGAKDRVLLDLHLMNGDAVSITGRQFFQNYGTEAHREVFDTNFWVDALMQDLPQDDTLVIITDVRFPNESEAIRPGEVWEILRAGQDDSDTHASEQPLPRDYVDRTILNNQGIEHFRVKILDALKDTLIKEDIR